MKQVVLDEKTLKRQAAKNDPVALCALGLRLYAQAADDVATDEAIKCLHLSMQLGYVPACYPLGRAYLKRRQADRALDAFREGRRGGDDECAYGYAVVRLFYFNDVDSLNELIKRGDGGELFSARALGAYYAQNGDERESLYWQQKADELHSANKTDSMKAT